MDQKVKLPPGMYLAWSGEFENQVRARKTMQVVFPAVILVIFVILYLTYNDFVDAVLDDDVRARGACRRDFLPLVAS